MSNDPLLEKAEAHLRMFAETALDSSQSPDWCLVQRGIAAELAVIVLALRGMQ